MAIYRAKISSGVQLALGFILTTAIFWFYWPVLLSLAVELSSNEDYSFGLLLPIVAAYIVYLKWPQLRSRQWQPSWAGLAVMALGFILYAFGELVAILYFPPVSFLVVISGLILLIGGWQPMSLLIFPMFLLFFMIPLPALVMKHLTLPLQLISSRLAAGFLQTVGIPVVLHGNVIDLGVRQLQVVEACSGLRYILSLTALGIIFCYFYQRCFWKALILLIAIVPAAVIANSLRVAAMGIFPALQEGFWHGFSGWLIFIFCFGFLALINYGLNLLRPASSPLTAEEPAFPSGSIGYTSRISLTLYLIGALVLVLMAFPLTLRMSQALPVPLLQSFDKFPLQLGNWQGKRDYLDKTMAQAVGADDYLEINFTNPDHGNLSLWIAYFENQSKKLEGRIHSPQLCLQGGGWNFIESKIVDMAPGLPVRYILMEQAGSRMVVYYWYLQRGRWLASEYSTKLFMGLDGLTKQRNDGAIVRLITPASPSAASARERLAAFGELLLPLLPQFIPQ